MIDAFLARLPLIAILRGVAPDEVVAISHALAGAGFAIIEVTFNSPDAAESIARLHDALGDTVLVGGGTVTRAAHVADIRAAGGRLAVMPHSDATVIRAAKDAGLACIPGVATPTDAFAALACGADALKLFPAELIAPAVVSALRSILPAEARLLPVGGITPEKMKPYLAAGASGFGLGSALYRRRDEASVVAENARTFVRAWTELSR